MATTDVLAEMTGTIWKVLASVGQTVSEDEVLIIVESMKMEIPVMAPEDGTVQEILVAEGQTVSEGDVILRLTAA
jgi:acetyl-CoA carboxylase biotin carboxyl carrier protein